ncbi:MAG: ABC transporter permease [Melioribacteraceae bacterium]|nr:ABC transporter permease [Melioribacteraceae bacterium]WKZ70052.1 MAG: ABC transporter permease [Melioribacteraceae bacterium]
MSRFKNIIIHLQDQTLLLKNIVVNLGAVKEHWDDTIQEMYLVGTKSLLLVFLGGIFSGVILAIETGHQLKIFGATALISRTVSLGMVRELGPVVTGLLLAARTGAKNASELGAMQLSDQIDALRAFGADPIRRLVVVRTIAATLMFLPLTLIADIAGILGGMLVANQTFHVDMNSFWNTAISVLEMKDLFVGFIKPLFYGFFVGSMSCYFGLKTKGGTAGLGKNTVNAVVFTSVTILILDFIFTKIVWEVL